MNYFILTLLGLCFGSFTNAFVWRLHEQQTLRGKEGKLKHQQLSITRGRSMCVYCHHQLGFLDLLPVVSWVVLRGRCRYCHKPIDDNPLVEIVTPLLFIGSYIWWPYGWTTAGMLQFVLWLVFLVGFVALAVYDLRWMLLPNRVVYPLLGLAIGQTILLALLKQDLGLLFDAFWGFLVLGGLFYVLFQVSGGKWIGGGDVKLGFVLGILSGGAVQALLLLFLASALGTLASVPLLLSGKLKNSRRIPFGPFLLLAGIIVYLFGRQIVDWYTSVMFIN